MVSIRKRCHLAIHERYKVLNQFRLSGRHPVTNSKLGSLGMMNQRRTVNSMKDADDKNMVTDSRYGPTSIDVPSNKDASYRDEGNSLKNKRSYRRKQLEKQDTCMLRGVYYKNMKWQAAIKVEKKQIHLGTVSNMEEAAHLYDRAAYICGRVPNFELTEEEKQELQGLRWDEFLLRTKEAIANKKKQKRVETILRKQCTSHSINDDNIKASVFQSQAPQSLGEFSTLDEKVALYHSTKHSEQGSCFQLPISLAGDRLQ